MNKKLSTDPYKGVRDFYPADMSIQKRIFAIWRDVAEKYGYEEYGASVLEPAELYRAKSGEEIVNEQTYTFQDRGEREVTLRPEMTPTVARMVAHQKRELVFPLRWYSIPNLFRYEQPQRGRTREHWQLNVDIFGTDSVYAEIEVINMAYDITRAYGLTDNDFEIRVNNRKITDYITRSLFALNEEVAKKVCKLIDKKDRMNKESFEASIKDFLGDKANQFITLLNSKNFQEFTSLLPKSDNETLGISEIQSLIQGLENVGVKNVRFDQTLMRGFDYYTGTVFEIFDMNPANRRSVFGGGRYDDLTSLFGNEKVTAFGFGAGDLIARDLMETYDRLPDFRPPTQISICILNDSNTPYAMDLAQDLRSLGLNVSVDLSLKKIGEQIANANKRSIPMIICIGDEEVATGQFKVKILETGLEIPANTDNILEKIAKK